MPQMDAFAFRRIQMTDPELSTIPVLVVSGGGYVNEGEARKLGIAEYFRKPLDFSAFVDTLHAHCDQAR
jgi:hypothetical protein